MQKVATETPTKAGLAEEVEVEHRPGLQVLDGDEDREQDGAADQRAEDQGAAPALGVAAQHAEDDQEERRREGEQAPDVGARRLRVARLAHPRQGDEQRERADRDVDEEDPAPVERVGEDPADERSRRHGDADRRSPDGDRAADVGPAVLGSDQRERRGEERRAPDALHRAGDVEHGDVPGQAAEQRREREDDHADGEEQPAAVAVGERARGQDQRRQRQRVGVDHPLQPRQARVEVVLDVRQRDVDDRDVEQEHERRRADGDERPAAVAHEGLGLHRAILGNQPPQRRNGPRAVSYEGDGEVGRDEYRRRGRRLSPPFE